MSELEVVSAVLGGLAALAGAGLWAGARAGFIEWSVSLKVVPAGRRQAAQVPASPPAVVPGEVLPLPGDGKAA